MAETYIKLFGQILTSSIWDEDDQTRLVWITMMAMADRDGIVRSTTNGIAVNARVPKEAAARAIAKFLSPDPESRTPYHEGRRVEVVEGGWHLLNHAKYREKMSLESRKEYWRKKKLESRMRERQAAAGMTAKEIVDQKVQAQMDCDKVL